MKTALIAGASGLVGSQLLSLLLNDNYYHRVIALSRKPLELHHRNLENVVIDFDHVEQYKDRLVADDVFCCLGTTMKQAGSKEAFKKVDHDYPIRLANVTLLKGASTYLLISALGSNKNSSVYYNKIKGLVEEEIASMHFKAVHIFRPALLLGPREEKRAGEDAAKIFFNFFNFIIPKKYKAIHSEKVARAMLKHAKNDTQGVQYHESGELQNA